MVKKKKKSAITRRFRDNGATSRLGGGNVVIARRAPRTLFTCDVHDGGRGAVVIGARDARLFTTSRPSHGPDVSDVRKTERERERVREKPRVTDRFRYRKLCRLARTSVVSRCSAPRRSMVMYGPRAREPHTIRNRVFEKPADSGVRGRRVGFDELRARVKR